MTPAKPKKAEFEFTGKHMLLLMLVFFGVIMAVNFTMASMASRTWTGLIVKNSYVASQKFNEELQQAKAQQASGIYSELGYSNSQITFVLKDKDDKSLSANDLTIAIVRPAFEQEDQVGLLIQIGHGSYHFPVELGEGEWKLQITGVSNGQSYRRDARLIIDSNGFGSVE